MAEQNSGENPKTPPKKYIWDEIKDEEITVIECPSGAKIETLKADGMTVSKNMADFGRIPDIRTNIPKIKEMNVRDDDALICAFPKSGTHWLWEIMAMLRKGKAEYETLPKERFMLEFNKPEVFDNSKSPRIFNTHLLFRQIPKQMVEKKCKIVFIQRNPKDVAVSFYNHKKNLHQNKCTWEDDIALFGNGTVTAFYSWFDYTLQWEKGLQDNRDIYSLYYEDLKQDAVGEIKKLAKYLEVKCDDQFATDIANKCSFDNLKKASQQKHDHFGGDKAKSNSFYRKGETGDWKNWFTVAQNERFDSQYNEWMKDSKLKFTYVLP